MPIAAPTPFGPPRGTIGANQDASWLRRALPLALTHKWLLGPSLALSFIALVIQVLIPDLLRKAIDNSLVLRTAGLYGYVFWISMLGVIFGVLTWAARALLMRAAYAIEYDLRNLLYERLSRMSFSFYDEVESGEVLSRSNSDVRAMNTYLAFAPSIIVQCMIAVIAFIVMLTIDVPLALIAMALTPLTVYFGRRMSHEIWPVGWMIQARLAEAAKIVDENVSGVRVVKSFAAEERQLRDLARVAKRVEWAYVKDADLRGRWAPVIENLPRSGIALLLLAGGWLTIQGHATIGTIVAFTSYILLLQAPFRALGMLIVLSQRASASAGRIFEILDRTPEVADSATPRDLPPFRGEIRFRTVAFEYPNGTPGLTGFDLLVHPGETVAIVGSTGSGKSTVARLLARFYDVRTGVVSIDGVDVRDLSLVSLRAQVGIVLDEPFLFGATVRENIAYGNPAAPIEDVIAAARAAQADRFIREMAQGYETVVGERGYTLSGGQRQRIAIARTLLLNPPILVLDDATSAIDVNVENKIHDALRTMLGKRTTLVIAHRPSTIALADRVIFIESGRVHAEGTHADLLTRIPEYAALFSLSRRTTTNGTD